MVLIRKASGDMEEFDPRKVKRAVLRSGGSGELADQILSELNERLYDGVTTREIFKFVHASLHSEQPSLASRYDLKGAIMRLGPDGFAFETYVGEVLQEYGYKTQLRQLIRGVCVRHEIDVVAEKDGKRVAIECKYHNYKGLRTGLKEALYTYARLLDLNEGCTQGHCPHFDEIWLVTNTRFSTEAIQYAKCKELKLLGWRYPPGETLEKMIESKGLYPITILKSLDKKSKTKFFNADLILAKDILDTDPGVLAQKTRVRQEKLRELASEAERFYGL